MMPARRSDNPKGPTTHEGDWVGFPLASGGYGLGRITRENKNVLLIYAFGCRYPEPPSLADTEGLNPQDNILIMRTGDLGIRVGEWRLLHQVQTNWNEDRVHWPIPPFRGLRPEPSGMWVRWDLPDQELNGFGRMSFMTDEQAKAVPNEGGSAGYKYFETKVDQKMLELERQRAEAVLEAEAQLHDDTK